MEKKGDKPFEIDFEIGHGTKKHREELNTKTYEANVYGTSQMFSSNSERFKIKT